MNRELPLWVDREEYPFAPALFDTGQGMVAVNHNVLILYIHDSHNQHLTIWPLGLELGANGNLGRRLIASLAGRAPVRAVVRSERAARMLDDSPGEVDIRIIDYLDSAAMSEAAAGWRRALRCWRPMPA